MGFGSCQGFLEGGGSDCFWGRMSRSAGETEGRPGPGERKVNGHDRDEWQGPVKPQVTGADSRDQGLIHSVCWGWWGALNTQKPFSL